MTVVDLLNLDPTSIAQRCPLPSRDVHKLVKDVTRHMQKDALQGAQRKRRATEASAEDKVACGSEAKQQKQDPVEKPLVRTLDKKMDEALNGGIRPGYVTEIAGESAVGKTQLALGLLLSAQLAPPVGLGKSSIYLSSEGPLNTKRLYQMLHQPEYEQMKPHQRPTLDHVHTLTVSDLEKQEHIIRFHLPVAIKRYDVGLVVLDSIAATFRAEHGTRTPAQLADRAVEITNLGSILRRIAIDYHVAVVVINQVSDRFEDSKSLFRSSSPATTSSPGVSGSAPPLRVAQLRQETQSLDHQQRFFIGWGDGSEARNEQQKTPTLGLVWANQISARIVLKMESERQEYTGGNIWRETKRSRTLTVVFAPWAPPTDIPIRYEIAMQGIVSVAEPEKQQGGSKTITEEYPELLDEALWADDEYP